MLAASAPPDFAASLADAVDPPAPGDEDPTPGALAQRLDPMVVHTPALELIDSELVDIRDGLTVMYERRQEFSELARAGVPAAEAVTLAQERVAPAGNDRLLVSMPPQEGKTTAIGRYGLLWLLRQFPGLRIGLVSYDGVNASRISYMARGDIELNDGTAGNPDLGLRLMRDQKAISRWRIAPPHEGEAYAIGIGGGLTGRPLDLLVIDDPVKDDDAASSMLRSTRAWLWWMGTARPRLAPWAPVIVVATRWHEADLIGRLLTKQKEDEEAGLEHYDRWRVINIPAQADHDPSKDEVDVLGRQPGEFMASARGRTRAQWEATKNGTAPRLWTALYQGRPSPDVGEIWLKQWWRRYSEPLWSQQPDGSFRLQGFDTAIQSWDCAFRDTSSSDYVVGQVWAKKGADCWLIYQVWARLSFTATLDAFKRVTRLFPDTRRKLIEAKANGDAVISSLKHEIPGIIPSEPTESKKARAEAVSPFIRAGNVHLPTSQVASMSPEISWDPDGLIVEATAFPNGAHDDQVDAASQALAELYLGPGGPGELLVPTGGNRPGQLPGIRGRW